MRDGLGRPTKRKAMTDTTHTEFAWVIERYEGDTLMYWDGRRADSWSREHGDAIRFARKQDADAVLHRLAGGIGRAVEHGWGP